MPDSLENSNIHKHRYWQPQRAFEEDRTFLRSANRRALFTIAVMGLSIAVSGYSAYRLAKLTLQPVPVAGKMANGWIFGGIQQNFVVTPENEVEIWSQILEAHFARTEKGRLPGLENFSTPDTLSMLDGFLRNYGDSRSLRLTIIETRVAGRNSSEAALLIRGRLTIIGTGGKTATSEVFLTPYFRVFGGSGENPSGWRLAGLKKLTRDDFYSREREEERNKLLGLPSKS